MLKTVWATIRQERIELLEATELPEEAKVLVMLLPDESEDFWLQASQPSIESVWDNATEV